MKNIILILTLGLASVISNPVTTSSEKPCIKSVKNNDNTDVSLHTDFTGETVLKEIEAINSSTYDIPGNSEETGNIEVIFNSADNTLLKENEIIDEAEEYIKPLQNTQEIENTDVASNIGDGTPTFGDGVVDIVIEEDPVPSEDIDNTTPYESTPEIQSTVDNGLSMTHYLFRNALESRIQDEIMASAKGFAPLPIFSFRRKQNPRRRFAIRRRYNRYPYRRFHSAYPYYAFYRPSSLRFY
ncbi:unnamed protein product [Arctia plantaginis]|uniref:Uncharacterized protein n=1 Tax=Arctia plantaginis TaxID=874455 RepID=A0A8S0YR25_ARCPL|nr:unnamed protein product [Arctia plantaginis]